MLREILISLALSVAGLTALFVVVLLMQMVGKFDVISTSTIISFIPGFSVGYQTLLLPIATLTALSLAYSRLSAAGEKTALFCSAVSPRKVLLPAVLVGVILILPAAYSAFKLAPDAYRERDRIKADALADALSNPPPGTQEFNFPSFSLAYSDFENETYHDLVMIRDDAKGRDVVLCKRARITYDEVVGQLTIYNGEPTVNLRLSPEGNPDRFVAQMDIIKVSQPMETYNQQKSYPPKGYGPRALYEAVGKEAADKKKDKRHFANEFARRIASTFAPLFFALIGALVAMSIPVKNKIVPLFIGLLAAAGTYFGGLSIARPLAQSTAYPPSVGIALAQVVIFGPMLLLSAGLWLKARRG